MGIDYSAVTGMGGVLLDTGFCSVLDETGLFFALFVFRMVGATVFYGLPFVDGLLEDGSGI